jgi:spermidine synthase
MTDQRRTSTVEGSMQRVFFSVAILSAGVLAYEILLTRLLSIVQWHHFAYMIISLALLGFGASGTFLTFAGRRLAARFNGVFAVNAGLFALSSFGCFAVVQSLPLNLLEIFWSADQLVWLALVYVLLMLPFFFAANCIALTFVRFPEVLATTYAFDLAGAGLGCGAVLWMLHVAAPGGVLAPVAAAGVLAAVVTGIEARWLRWSASLAVLGIAVFLLHASPLVLRVSEYKGLAQAERVSGATVVATRSSPLGLLTVVENPRVPFRHAPGLSITAPVSIPPQVAIYTDADSATMITRYDGDRDAIAYMDRLSSALPYHLGKIDSVLVLGAGAGADVLQALYHGAEHITAVELNAQLVDFVGDEYPAFSGNIYRDDRVDVQIAEARDFVAGVRQRYDLIQMTGLDAFGTSASGLRAVNENYLYTVEALQAYLDRLNPGGLLGITRWVDLPPRDGIKLFATAVAALEARGVEDPGSRLAWVRSWNSATLIIKNGELTGEQTAALREFSGSRSFDVAYYPGMSRDEANRYNILSAPQYFDAATALLGPGRERFLSSYKFRVSPSTDDRPFHFHFFKWRHFPELLALRARGGMGLLELGYIVLIAALIQAVVVSIVLILLPLAWLRRAGGDSSESPWSRGMVVGYFLCIGFAFLFIEIAFIQIFVRFLGHPVYSVTVMLASFLLFAAVGSRLAAAFEKAIADRRKLMVATSVIVVICVAYAGLLPAVLAHFAGVGGAWRAVVAVVLVAPLAMAMGMPFPLGLRSLHGVDAGLIPWAWAINGCASVVSAVLAMHFGFTAVILIAATFYCFAALIGWRGLGRSTAATMLEPA